MKFASLIFAAVIQNINLSVSCNVADLIHKTVFFLDNILLSLNNY